MFTGEGYYRADNVKVVVCS